MNKEQVHILVSASLQERIKSLELILKDSLAAASEDTKSSAGDKHETAVAMAQLEQEKLSKQIKEYVALQQILQHIDPNQVHYKIELGSLVETNNGWYYFSVGLGAITFKGINVFFLTLQAPIGQLMLGKKAGESVVFRGATTEVYSVS
jgi:transcription elongation GreA/GreB family factor